MKYLHKFLSLTFQEQKLFLEAFFFQLISGFILKIVPFKSIPTLFKGPEKELPAPAGSVEKIRDAIHRSGRLSPWRNRCLVQSLAAKRMLNRRGFTSRLSLGVAKSAGGRLIAHAWLSSGEIAIVDKSGEYTELFLF